MACFRSLESVVRNLVSATNMDAVELSIAKTLPILARRWSMYRSRRQRIRAGPPQTVFNSPFQSIHSFCFIMSFFSNKVTLLSVVAGWFSSTVYSLPATSAATVLSGQATYYGGNTNGGMCSFSGYTLPSGIYGTAMSDSNWAGANICGACISVTGSAGEIIAMVSRFLLIIVAFAFARSNAGSSFPIPHGRQTARSMLIVSRNVQVTDQCPGCGINHLDLYQDAFPHVGDVKAGKIPVTWSVVPCGIKTPLTVRNKSGTSKYWFSMQVVNSNTEVTALDVSIDGGKTWKTTTRQPYNYFENSSGFGTDTVTVRITSSNGKTITVSGMSVASETSKTASSNF